MNQTITFTLTKDEYLQYLRDQVCWMKEYRGYKFWIRTSIPSLLVCSALYFRWYQHLWISIGALVIAVLWLLFGAGFVWRLCIRHRITQQVLDNMNIKGFQQITLRFLSDKVICEDAKTYAIAYTQIHSCKPLKDMFAIQYQKDKVIVLPYRIFRNEEHIKQFLYEFNKAWLEEKQNMKRHKDE